MKKINILALALIFIMAGCKKYEDGPALSLRSKKTRLVGEWTIVSVAKDNVDITADFKSAVGDDYELHFEKDGKYHTHGSNPDDGTWAFTEKKEHVICQSSVAGSEAEDFIILKLKTDELWLKHIHDDGTYVFKYKQ